MAVQLFKLVMSAQTNTNAVPTAYNYFHAMSATVTTTELFVPNGGFFKNNGSAASTIVLESANNGYYSLFINGVLQQTALYTVAASGLTVSHTPALAYKASEPITLTVTNFVPTSSTIVTG